MMVEEYQIKNSEEIKVDFFEGFVNLKKVIVDKTFKIDEDCYTRFGRRTPKLESFEVIDKDSPFFAMNGVLYMNIDKARLYSNENGEPNHFIINSEVPDSIHGVMLIALPTNYQSPKFKIPDFVDAIGCSAICGTSIEELIIPPSVKFIALGNFDELPNLKTLEVPSCPIFITWDCNCLGREISIKCSEENKELDDEIYKFWFDLISDDRYSWKTIKLVREKLGIK